MKIFLLHPLACNDVRGFVEPRNNDAFVPSADFEPDSVFAYVGGESILYKCGVDINGEFYQCAPTGEPVNATAGLTIFNGTRRGQDQSVIYYALPLADSIRSCEIDKLNGELNNCTYAAQDIPGAIDLTIVDESVFITNDLNGTVTKCQIDQDFTFTDCEVVLEDVKIPYGITYDPETGVVYIIQEDEMLILCSVVDGELENCAEEGFGFKGVNDIVLFEDFAYLPNFERNSVIKCNKDPSTGSLSTCGPTGGLFENPSDIEIRKDQRQAYVLNSLNESVTTCSINGNGDFEFCFSSAQGRKPPDYVAVSRRGAVFASNFEEGVIYKCDRDSIGTMRNCTITGPKFLGPDGMAVWDDKYLFIAEAEGVFRCDIGNENELENCRETGTRTRVPSRISVTGSTAYIANRFDPHTVCDIVEGGELENCRLNDAISGEQASVEAYGSTYVYISSYQNQTVSVCTLTPEGDLKDCQIALSNATSPQITGPLDVGAYDFGYVYVVDSKANTIYRCFISVDGFLESCTVALDGLNSPRGISFDSLNHAYITHTYDSVLRCDIGRNRSLVNCNYDGDFDPRRINGVAFPQSIALGGLIPPKTSKEPEELPERPLIGTSSLPMLVNGYTMINRVLPEGNGDFECEGISPCILDGDSEAALMQCQGASNCSGFIWETKENEAELKVSNMTLEEPEPLNPNSVFFEKPVRVNGYSRKGQVIGPLAHFFCQSKSH